MNYDPNLHPSLERGCIGEAVARLQKLLIDHGYPLSIDGDFGPGTSRVVTEFQSDRGIMPTSIVDEETWEALLGESSSAPPTDSTSGGSALDQRVYEALVELQVPEKSAALWFKALSNACLRYNINTVNQLSGFLANVVHEAGHFKSIPAENLNYSAQALMKNWPTRFSASLANQVGRTAGKPADQKAIAIIAYGGRMGNASSPSTDGWDYRGRGPIQLTGRSNYTAFAEDSGYDVVNDPELVLKPEVGSDAAGWFWKVNNCAKPANAGDLRSLRKIINGGTFGLEEITEMFHRIKPIF